MQFLFSDTYLTKRSYNCELSDIITIIKKFSNINAEIFYDPSRQEFFIKSKKFSIVCELEKIGTLINITFTTHSNYRFNMPKTYTLGLIGYIEKNIKKSS